MLVSAAVSVVTMPVTAVWFLLLGGLLVVVGLVPAVLGRSATAGAATFVGLGLLVGPAIYLALALLQ